MKQRSITFVIFFLILSIAAFTQTWDYTKRITYNSGESRSIRAAVDSSHVLHAVWNDDTPGNYEIFYKNATSGGSGTWSSVKRLTYTSGESFNPTIVISSADVVHVAWQDDSTGNREIFHKFTTDNGVTWTAPKRVTWSSGESKYPHLFLHPTYSFIPVICYSDDTSGDYEIYYKELAITSWANQKRLTWSTGNAQYPCGGVDGNGDIHIVWQDSSPGQTELYHKKSTDAGDSWSALTRITYTNINSNVPKFIFTTPTGTTNSYLRLTWFEYTGSEGSIYYRQRPDTTGVWSTPKRLTWNSDQSITPSILADQNGHIHIVYSDDKAGQYDLFHKKSTDEGVTWSTITRLTWTTGDTYSPHLFMSPSNNYVRLVYYDDTPGNRECYFKRGSQTSTLEKE